MKLTLMLEGKCIACGGPSVKVLTVEDCTVGYDVDEIIATINTLDDQVKIRDCCHGECGSINEVVGRLIVTDEIPGGF